MSDSEDASSDSASSHHSDEVEESPVTDGAGVKVSDPDAESSTAAIAEGDDNGTIPSGNDTQVERTTIQDSDGLHLISSGLDYDTGSLSFE
jgi:hypothetical protein